MNGCKPRRRNRGCPPVETSLGSWRAIVDHYIANKRNDAASEMAFYARSSLDVVVLSRTDGRKRHDHQRRIPESSLRAALDRLDRCLPLPCDLRDFDALHQFINSAIRDIPKIGELVVYDVAHRVGAQREIEPSRVYLHAGTRVGARAFRLRGKSIAVDELPPEFQRLSPAECEDCLCIYHAELGRIADAHQPMARPV